MEDMQTGRPYHNYELREEGFKKPSLLQISALYSFCIVLFLVLGSKVQRREFYSGVIITEFVLLMLPALLMLLAYRYDIKKVLRLNRVRPLNLFIVVCLMISAIPLVGAFNMLNIWLVKLFFGKVVMNQPPVAADPEGLLLSVLVIGASAGICEEILFRGIIQRGLERLGTVKSILIAAFLFGLMHVDMQKLFGTFLLGALIGFIVYRTNSLFAGMIAHFTNNTLGVLLMYVAGKAGRLAENSGLGNRASQNDADRYFAAVMNMPPNVLIATAIMFVIIIGVFAAIFGGLMTALIHTTSGRSVKIAPDGVLAGKTGFFALIPGLLLVLLIYVGQGLQLKGTKLEMVDNLIRLIGLR